jgi:hypothetical protein
MVLGCLTCRAVILSQLPAAPHRSRFRRCSSPRLVETELCSWKLKDKGKADPVDTMKAYRESTGISPFILYLGLYVGECFNFTPRPLYPWKITLVKVEVTL